MLHHSILPLRNLPLILDNDWFSNNFFGNQLKNQFGNQLANPWMDSAIQEDEQAFYISVDIPGAKKEQVQVSVENNWLSIEVKQEPQEKSQEEKEQEQQPRKFLATQHLSQRTGQKVFQIGKAIDEENIEAQLQDGVLYLKLSKKQPQQSKRIIDLQ